MKAPRNLFLLLQVSLLYNTLHYNVERKSKVYIILSICVRKKNPKTKGQSVSKSLEI